MQAVLGKLPKKSGVELATMIRSISLGCRPAMASALLAAFTARSDDFCSGAAKWARRDAAALTIHSSEVSMPLAAS
jgi:hypothetical protein